MCLALLFLGGHKAILFPYKLNEQPYFIGNNKMHSTHCSFNTLKLHNILITEPHMCHKAQRHTEIRMKDTPPSWKDAVDKNSLL